MKKVKIYLKINNLTIEEMGILKDNNLKFLSNNVKYEFNLTDLILKRENDEFLSIIRFKEKLENNFYLLKEINKEIINNLIIKELQVSKNIVIIRYEIEKELFNLLLNYEEV